MFHSVDDINRSGPWHISQCIVYLMLMLFHTHAYNVSLVQKEKEEQYLTGQTYMNSNKVYNINWHNSHRNTYDPFLIQFCDILHMYMKINKKKNK
jgi:hypothetical protein